MPFLSCFTDYTNPAFTGIEHLEVKDDVKIPENGKNSPCTDSDAIMVMFELIATNKLPGSSPTQHLPVLGQKCPCYKRGGCYMTCMYVSVTLSLNPTSNHISFIKVREN